MRMMDHTLTCCSRVTWFDSSRGDVHVEFVQGIHGEEDDDPPDEQDRLTVAAFLKSHIYGRTRRIHFSQLTQRQWRQYPLPYDRTNRLVLPPDWFTGCVADLDAAAEGEEDDEVEESDGEDDE
jgi:hypothetical protein